MTSTMIMSFVMLLATTRLASASFDVQSVHRRWLSVPEVPKQPVPFSRPGPWPDGTIRYCFWGERSHTRLSKLLEDAIARWKPAMEHSTLKIQPDSPESQLCNERARGTHDTDVLRIWDATDDTKAPTEQTCATQTSWGYLYLTRLDVGNPEFDWRHSLVFCHYFPGTENDNLALSTRVMMHELSHAIGLQHEFQRNDRDYVFKFRCENLEGFDAAVNEMLRDTDWWTSAGYDEGEPAPNDKLNLMCHTFQVAKKFFPIALEWMVAKEWTTHESQGPIFNVNADDWDVSLVSQKIDRESITLYDYNIGGVRARIDLDNPATWVLCFRETTLPDGQTLPERPTYAGNNPDPSKAKISAGDIARVAQLYPKPDGASEAAMEKNVWNAMPMGEEEHQGSDCEGEGE